MHISSEPLADFKPSPADVAIVLYQHECAACSILIERGSSGVALHSDASPLPLVALERLINAWHRSSIKDARARAGRDA